MREWLLIATLPGSGSTALAHFVAKRFDAGFIGPNGEAMWTIPDFTDCTRIWSSDFPDDMSSWRTQWLATEAALPDGTAVVDKSPANLARVARLLALFADRRVTLVRLTRHPYAVGSNWLRRYSPSLLAELHADGKPVSVTTEPELIRFVGDAVGRRMRLLHDLSDVAGNIRYENFAADWQTTVEALHQACPNLVLRQDPEPMEIYDANTGALAGLSGQPAQWFAQGLAPHADVVVGLGYDPEPPPLPARRNTRCGAPTFLHGDDAAHQPGAPPIGRRIAWASLLDAVARHTTYDSVGCLGLDGDAVTDFTARFRRAGYRGSLNGARIADHGPVEGDVLVLPDPVLSPFAWRRARSVGPGSSLCGIIHGASDLTVAQELRALVSAPVDAHDALICTSNAVRRAVDEHLDATARYLSERFGCAITPRLQRPIIPLGIHVDTFSATEEGRVAQRNSWGVEEDTCVVLCLARLSILEKFHPSTLFRAVEIAAAAARTRITLVVAGWFASPDDEAVFHTLAAQMAPSVEVRFVDGETAWLAYAGADLFVLPVDSIQESFGLAPLEAMAARLPVVVSDWNGLAETVVHGTTGITVPTLMAPAGAGLSIARRHADGEDSYLSYLGQVQQRIAIDIGAMGAAIADLADAPDRRRAMGAAGHARARETYDWSVLIPQYEALWEELSERLRHAGGGLAHDITAIDPFSAFAGYASAVISASTRVVALTETDEPAIAQLTVAVGDDLVGYSVCDPATLARMANAAEGRARSLKEIAAISGVALPQVIQGALWLLKHGVLQRVVAPS